MSEAANLTMAFISLLKEMGGGGITAVLVAFLIIPPVLGFLSVVFGVRALRSLEKTMVGGMARVEMVAKDMAQRYDNNVLLVEDHQKLVRGHLALTDSVLEIVQENTKAITLAVARMEGASGR